MVQSVPGELSLQETSVLTVASNQELGSVTLASLMKELKWVSRQFELNGQPNGGRPINGYFSSLRWTELRAQQAIDKIVGDGLAWVDEQDEEKSYWFPSLFPKRPQTASNVT